MQILITKARIVKVCCDLKNISKKSYRIYSISDNVTDGENSSLIQLQIEPLIIDSNHEFNSTLNHLRAQLQFHNIQIINKFERTHGITECDIVFSTGKTLKIRVCPIPSNGDCLFGAIVHQHLFLEVGSDKYVQRVAELRKEVVFER